MKFSIIIPVYNVEKYIERCLLSVLNQSYQNYEVIVIDDGSKDKSGEICDKLAEKYERMLVKHIPNGGVSNARNIGLEQASGDYVWFVDSDDYIEKDALQKLTILIEKHINLDWLIFDAVVIDEEENRKGAIVCNLPCEQSVCFDKYRDFVFVNTSLWNRVFRLELIRKENILFEKNITIAEDLLFNYKYLLKCQNVYYEKEQLYYYTQRKNSAMSGAGKDKDLQRVFECLNAYCKEKGVYDIYKNEIEYLAIYHYFLVTSVRMIRSNCKKEECLVIPKWFEQQGIAVTLRNPYVRKMAPKHILVFVLLKLKCYKIISMLFSKL